MKKIEPYKNINDAISSLDNGGRFYNILTKADDGIISKSELGKAGEIFNNKQRMILFFELSISKLDERKRNVIISKLEKKLQQLYKKYKPIELLPSEINSKGILSSNTIITGIPRLIEVKSDSHGFIIIPVMIGNITTYSIVPLFDVYKIYKLRDEESDKSFIIAHSKRANKLPEKKIKVAGVLKELKSDKNEKIASKKFLEVVYHMEIN